MRSTWDAEDDARMIVAAILIGRATPTDLRGGSDQLHDFDVECFDGKRLAVEVTRCTNPSTRQAQAEIDTREWRSPALTHSWYVGLAPSVRVRSVTEWLVDAVVLIEHCGLEKLRLRPCFFDGTAIYRMQLDDRQHAVQLRSHGLQDVARRWYDQGARRFVQLRPADPAVGGEVSLELPPSAGWTDPSELVDVAEEYASKPDSISKLEKAIAHAERHLFVWIDDTMPEPFGAFNFGVRGLPDPHLPASIDAVWLASTVNQVVRWHRQEGWRDFGLWRA